MKAAEGGMIFFCPMMCRARKQLEEKERQAGDDVACLRREMQRCAIRFGRNVNILLLYTAARLRSRSTGDSFVRCLVVFPPGGSGFACTCGLPPGFWYLFFIGEAVVKMYLVKQVEC